jgi:hypothetical protein
LADGASFIIEASKGAAAGASLNKEDVKSVILEVLAEVAGRLE